MLNIIHFLSWRHLQDCVIWFWMLFKKETLFFLEVFFILYWRYDAVNSIISLHHPLLTTLFLDIISHYHRTEPPPPWYCPLCHPLFPSHYNFLSPLSPCPSFLSLSLSLSPSPLSLSLPPPPLSLPLSLSLPIPLSLSLVHPHSHTPFLFFLILYLSGCFSFCISLAFSLSLSRFIPSFTNCLYFLYFPFVSSSPSHSLYLSLSLSFSLVLPISVPIPISLSLSLHDIFFLINQVISIWFNLYQFISLCLTLPASLSHSPCTSPPLSLSLSLSPCTSVSHSTLSHLPSHIRSR